jgi:hypothetical protein
MNFEVPHLAIDIETLGKGERAVITALSAVIWNFEMDKDITYDEILKRTFYIKLDVIDQIKRLKRVTDQSTLDWWKTMPLEVQEMSIKTKPDDIKIDEGLVMLRDYLKEMNFNFKKSYIWTRGIAYDIPKIETIIEDVSLSPVKNAFNKDFTDKTTDSEKKMLNNFRARDIRTYSDLIGNSENGKIKLKESMQPTNFIEHHAKHDIALDVLKMMFMYHE